MIYQYFCGTCSQNFDVIKPMADSSREEKHTCGAIATRVYLPPQISVPKFEADYYHSLGKVIHNKRELSNELAKRDLVPIGNDYGSGEKMQQSYDKARDEAREKKWDKAMENIDL